MSYIVDRSYCTLVLLMTLWNYNHYEWVTNNYTSSRGEICRRQCKFFASGVNVFIFTHFLVFLSTKLLKFNENKGVKFLAWKSGGVKCLTNLMSDKLYMLHIILVIKVCRKVHCLGRAIQPRRAASTQLAPSVTLRVPPHEVLCPLRIFSFFQFQTEAFD